MIGIIDYEMGNLRSVQKAFTLVGAEAAIISSADVAGIDSMVLPGVGAFADGMAHLRRLGWIEPILRFLDSGRPFLGICLGMQLLFERSQEDAPRPDQPIEGLGVFAGTVEALSTRGPDGQRLKVPHMGWNSLKWTRDDPLLRQLVSPAHVYFVHGFHVRPEDEQLVSATTDYGGLVCASIWRHNIWATQFHPEKSQQVGLRMLAGFARAKP